MQGRFRFPHVDYFEAGNGYSGSCEELRYKLFNQKETLLVKVWVGPYCLEKSRVLVSREFPITEEGIEGMASWLEEQYRFRFQLMQAPEEPDPSDPEPQEK